jgi:outer membrane lipoprotein-sorting protein
MGRLSQIALVVVAFVATTGCSGSKAAKAEQAKGPQVSTAGFFDAPKSTVKDPKAKAIVEAMYAAYAACKTYQDTGTVKFENSTVTFETRFKRPYQFYFEFTSAGGFMAPGRHVLWTHGGRTSYSGDVFGMKYEEDTVLTDMWPAMEGLENMDQPLGLAIASFTGISFRSAHTVPRMLFPVSCKEGMNYAVTEDLVYEGTKTDRGVECEVLFGKEWGERIWVDKKTHLLRRVETDMSMAGVRYVTTTVYEPKVDVEIKDEQLTFVPPK